MSQDNFQRVPWADPALVEVMQQMHEQIDSMDTLADTATSILSALHETMMQEVASGNVDKKNITDLTEAIDVAINAARSTLHQSTEQRRFTLQQTFRQLRHRSYQINTLYRIANLYGEKVGVEQVLSAALDAVWHKTRLQFAVIILGETELGPFSYQAMRGVSESPKYLGKGCPFPLWGLLARALLPRLDEDKPDYLLIRDIAKENLPLPEEFPWLPRAGSLLILPVRFENQARGAILLGSTLQDAFAEQRLREDLSTIAQHTARVLQLTQMQQELNTRSGHLLSLQLFTKSIASVRNYDKLADILVESIREAMGSVAVTVIFDQQMWQPSHTGSESIPTHVQHIIEWAMQAGQPIFYDPDDADGSLERYYYNESGHALVVPIMRNEQTQGAIQIVAMEQERRFDDGDMIVLRTIANCAAMVLRDLK